ncbi:response regulator [Aliidiomarina sanyensis]|uniref:Two-component system response regulator BaeR n=1 Tax=Aliidiomarina sanyensis TaxID=1249555 RepID=A0A432WPI5_9GAMM|nr:response regulator [Aliidiomarina sanyensis]RUO35720.1 two-component system response regulator BaeR [Aliidiomarina sanyensis]
MGRILVAEDEPEIGSLLKDYLEQAGHSCTHHLDGGEAWKAFSEAEWDLVLLDVMMPGLDGLELCRRIRERSRVPVFFITARHDEVDRIVGLKLGADDYIVKPFSPREVVARVEAQLRRQQWQTEPAQSASGATALSLDPGAYQARYGKVELELTPVEFRLLQTLSRHPGRVYRREELIHAAYDDHRVVSDRTVDSHIKNLRHKLSAAGAPNTLIQAVYGVGYKYTATP